MPHPGSPPPNPPPHGARPIVRRPAVAAVAANCLLGFPLQLASAVRFWEERDYDRVKSLVRRHVYNEGEWIYCDPSAYYPAQARDGPGS
ncbi:MAG: hypothetical protein JO284_02305 [Planctomycetaceae bacterium]|nr:hypothetical protein [Planctomycetaceae bacterium]